MAATPVDAADEKLSGSTGGTTIGDVRQETRDLLSTLGEYGVDQREAAVDAATAALFRLDNRIRDLELRVDRSWDGMTHTARERMRESLRALQNQRVALAEWYGGLKSDSGAAWVDLRRGFSRAFEDINQGWENALRAFDAETGADSET